MSSFKVVLQPKEKKFNCQIDVFPFDGLCLMLLDSSRPFFYSLHSIDTDTHYSDKPIFCKGKKELLPFGVHGNRIFSFDFENASELEIHITINYKFEQRHFSDKEYSFREYTLDGLHKKTPVVIAAGEEEEFSLVNFRGAHYEIHKIYSSLNKSLSCKLASHGKLIERFPLNNSYNFKRPWILNWADSVKFFIKNESGSGLKIDPTDICFAGYLIKPIKEIEAIAPINARNSFLIEGISLR